jgi:low temperature requirement protein LtrA
MPITVPRWFLLPRGPDIEAERRATRLELFSDLVFVAALSAVTARLPDNGVATWAELGATLGVFLVVHLAWLGHAFYDTRYDPEDIPHRLLVLLSVAGASAMTLGAQDLPAGDLLPLGYLAVRGTLIVMYLRVLATDRPSRELIIVYLSGFTFSWLLWLTSLGLHPQDRPPLWIAALTVDLATPWVGRRWVLRHPVHRSHLPERIAQFTTILIGGALVSLRAAAPDSGLSNEFLLAAGAALVVITSIWWVYTAFLTSQLAVPRLASGNGYAYIHMLIGAGILVAGWALGRVVHLTNDRDQGLPAMLRLVLALSIITWMVGMLGVWWFAVGVSPRRTVRTVVGVASVAAAAVLIRDPIVLSVLVALILAGYAAAVTAEIRRTATTRP